MFRLVMPVLFGAAVVGCSKKPDPTKPEGDGTDPNATYTIKFRGFEKGDKTEVVRTRDVTTATKTASTEQTKKDRFRYEYTETVLATAPDEPRPTKVTRVYKTADKPDPKGQMKPASYVGKTVTVVKDAKDAKGYKLTMDGQPIPALEVNEIIDDFNRGEWRLDQWVPKSAMKLGEEWSVDFATIASIGGIPPTRYNKEKSKSTVKLVRVYKKDDRQWGEIKLTITMVIDTSAEPGPKLTGQIDSEATYDIVIDGSARAGTMKMTTRGGREYPDAFGNPVKTSIEGTQEESLTPVK